MLIAWEVKTVSELTQAGYDGATTDKWPSHFVEIAQNGSGGQIVWQWNIWDHLIQDHDSNKDNYGVISNHPELVDINMISATGGGPPGMNSGDWFHVNGIDYNKDLDQIAFSSRHASEVYIIDHSTTTSEAATHAGGNSGKGGDILYRWGNPSNYGLSGNQIIPNAVHDIRWIENDGRPYGGYLQIFNNKGIDIFNISPTDKLSIFIDNSFNFRENDKEVGIHFYKIGKSCQVVIGKEIITIDKEQIIFTNEPTIIVDGCIINTIFEKFPLREIKIDDNNDWKYIKNYKFNK